MSTDLSHFHNFDLQMFVSIWLSLYWPEWVVLVCISIVLAFVVLVLFVLVYRVEARSSVFNILDEPVFLSHCTANLKDKTNN